LKALGLSRHEIATATTLEGIAVATIGVIGGLTLSLALGHLLIYVINPQSFGWTLSYHLPLGTMFGLAIACVAASTLVSYAVGYWGATLPAEQEDA
jgi:putative ABC transport system permease protein